MNEVIKSYSLQIEDYGSILLPHKVLKHLKTNDFVYFLSEEASLYSYDLNTKEILSIHRNCSTFDVSFDNKLAIGTVNGKIFIKDNDKFINYHWHSSSIITIKFNSCGNMVFSTSLKDVVHVYYLNTNTYKLIDTFVNINVINLREEYIEFMNENILINYNPRLETLSYKLINIKHYFIIEQNVKERVVKNKERYSDNFIRTKGIFPEVKDNKYICLENIKKTKELITYTNNYLIIYNLTDKTIRSKRIEIENVFVNNFIIIKNKNKVKIFDYNLSLIKEKEITENNYKNIIYLNNKLYFLKENILLEERITNLKVINDKVNEIFYYSDDLCILQNDSIKLMQKNEILLQMHKIKKVKIRENYLIFYDGNNVLVYKNDKEIDRIECTDLLDYDYDNGIIILKKENESKVLVKNNESFICPLNVVSLLSKDSVLLDDGTIHYLE